MYSRVPQSPAAEKDGFTKCFYDMPTRLHLHHLYNCDLLPYFVFLLGDGLCYPFGFDLLLFCLLYSLLCGCAFIDFLKVDFCIRFEIP